MKEAGYAHMGIGFATGKEKAEEAARMAITSPLLETSIDGAKGVIVNITASADIGLDEISLASSMITDQADADANIIWGAVLDENMEDEMSVTVIATGFSASDDFVKAEQSKKLMQDKLLLTEDHLLYHSHRRQHHLLQESLLQMTQLTMMILTMTLCQFSAVSNCNK